MGGGESSSAKRPYARVTKASHGEVYSTEQSRKSPWVCQENITFIEIDVGRVQHPHDDTLVVTLVIANHQT